jgi:hypothetical protein
MKRFSLVLILILLAGFLLCQQIPIFARYATFANLASFSSVAGFLISIFVVLSLWDIKKQFLFRARVPALHKSLRKHATQLSRYLQDFDNHNEAIDEELSLAEVNISSIRAKAPNGKLKRRLGDLAKEIRIYRKGMGPKLKPNLRSIYVNLNMLIQEISNLRADDQWGTKNG